MPQAQTGMVEAINAINVTMQQVCHWYSLYVDADPDLEYHRADAAASAALDPI